jgi:hypothetical protein
MFMWGNDNRFIQAGNQFAAMDQVLQQLRDMAHDTGFTARYSTPSQYFAAVERELGASASSASASSSSSLPPLALVRGGFMPYCDGIGDNCWTGYYATRPALKTALAQTRSLIRSSSTLATLALSHLLRTSGVKTVHEHDYRAWLNAAAAMGRSIGACHHQSLILLHHDVAAGTIRSPPKIYLIY